MAKRLTKEEKEKQAAENKRLLVTAMETEVQKKLDDLMGEFHNALTEIIGSSKLPIINQLAIFRMVEQELVDVALMKYKVK